MRVYGKEWGYNVYVFQYCLYWKGKKTGCTYEDGCCCPISQKPARRNGEPQIYPTVEMPKLPVSECDGCSYGRDSPCIGWCTKAAMRDLGLLRERDPPHV